MACLLVVTDTGFGGEGAPDGEAPVDLGRIRAVYLYEPGCPFCARFEKETLKTPKVAAALGKLRWIKVNAFTDDPISFDGVMIPQRKLAAKLRVAFYPTVLFLDPEGVELARVRGFFATADFMEMLGYITGGHFTRESFESYLDRMARANP